MSCANSEPNNKVGCPISTKKLEMKDEFLASAGDLYSFLTTQEVQANIITARRFYLFTCVHGHISGEALVPSKTRTHCGGNIVPCDALTLCYETRQHCHKSHGLKKCFWTFSETFFVSRTQNLCLPSMLRTWQNESILCGKHVCISTVASGFLPNVAVIASVSQVYTIVFEDFPTGFCVHHCPQYYLPHLESFPPANKYFPFNFEREFMFYLDVKFHSLNPVTVEATGLHQSPCQGGCNQRRQFCPIWWKCVRKIHGTGEFLGDVTCPLNKGP